MLIENTITFFLTEMIVNYYIWHWLYRIQKSKCHGFYTTSA